MIPPDIRSLVDRFADQMILVVGDVMLDHFVFGSVTRISPVEHRRDEYRLGGAANVAHNVQALGAQVRIVGVVGEDEAGARVVAGLGVAGADASGVRRDSGRLTTRKLRIVTTRNQQVARVDYEADEPLAPETEQALLAAAAVERVDGSTAVVISDYLKGAITPAVARGVIEAARRRNIPVLVDRNCRTSTPPRRHVHHAEPPRGRGQLLRISPWGCAPGNAVFAIELLRGVLSRGKHGMWLLDRPGGSGRGPGTICRPSARGVRRHRRRRHRRHPDLRVGGLAAAGGARRGPHRESRRGIVVGVRPAVMARPAARVAAHQERGPSGLAVRPAARAARRERPGWNIQPGRSEERQ
jgi:D-beta-D-heptose 7-phosphate kinase/D-beta-D-heptose 1-phosphate adenosyltransferase